MTVVHSVIRVPGGFQLHVEHHCFNPAFDSVILVNGALATATSFRQTIKYLGERHNAICFDLPYAGRSRQLNPGGRLLSKDDEVDILRHLIEQFSPRFLLSVSWGGVASLLALARGRCSVRRAVIASFSPFLNAAMKDYVTRARGYLEAGDRQRAAQLLNSTVGRYLPRLTKLYNHRYLASLPPGDEDQVMFHIDQILAIRPERYLPVFRQIRCPLKFINGALDEYTTPAEVRAVAAHVPDAEFAAIDHAGHFLDLEGRQQWLALRASILDFFAKDEPVAHADSAVAGAHC